MIRSFYRWIHVVLPPPWVVLAAGVIYAIIEGVYLVFNHWYRIPAAHEPFLDTRDAVVAMLCVLYGLFRVLAFHPMFRDKYRKWLEGTPWSSRKPLPAGPVHLVPQDVFILTLFGLALHGSPDQLVIPPTAFLGSYLAALAMSMWATGVWRVAYAVAFGLGLAVRVGFYPLASVGVLVALYPLARFGIRRTLEGFPWEISAWIEKQLLTAKSRTERGSWPNNKFGWPYDRLQFHQPDRLVPRKDAVLASFLVGWLLYAVVSVVTDSSPVIPPDLLPILGMVSTINILMFAIGRTVIYCATHWTPISLWGRLWTLRWIIPSYDRVFVVPLLVLAVDGLTLAIVKQEVLPPQIVFPVGVTLALLLTLNVGPTLKQWDLTGNHHIIHGLMGNTEFERL